MSDICFPLETHMMEAMQLTLMQSRFSFLFIDSNSSLKETGNVKQSDILQSKLIRVLVSEKCQRAQRLTSTETKYIQISLRDEPAIN